MKKAKTIKTRLTIKERTSTNYPPDPHHIFCKRCYKFNKGCPNTKSKVRDSECRL